MNDKYAAIRLKNQLCFPLYAVSNMITRKYKPLLDRLDLTYTQYIVMMVLWEEKRVNEKFLCEALCLKSNTVTPLLQKLSEKGFIKKEKDLRISFAYRIHQSFSSQPYFLLLQLQVSKSLNTETGQHHQNQVQLTVSKHLVPISHLNPKSALNFLKRQVSVSSLHRNITHR